MSIFIPWSHLASEKFPHLFEGLTTLRIFKQVQKVFERFGTYHNTEARIALDHENYEMVYQSSPASTFVVLLSFCLYTLKPLQLQKPTKRTTIVNTDR